MLMVRAILDDIEIRISFESSKISNSHKLGFHSGSALFLRTTHTVQQ